MTRFHKALHPCSHCGSEEEVVIWDIVDAEQDPDLKERLLQKKLQVAECQNCGEEQLLALPLLYVDSKLDLVYYYCPQFADILHARDNAGARHHGSNLPEGLAEELDQVFPPGLNEMKMRLVPIYNDLIEKIHLSDYELDDRLMEVVKIALRSRYLSEEQLRFEAVFFLSASEDTLLFQVFEAEQGWNSLEIYREIYDNAEAALEDRLPEEGRWLLIDEQYALRIIEG